MVVLRLVNAVQKLSSTTGRVPLRARAVPEGSNQAESIHFLRTRLGEDSAEMCTVWSCLLLYWSLPAAYLDRVIGFLNYTPSSPPQPSSNGWTSRARARVCLQILSHVVSNFLTLYSAVEKVCLWAVFLFMKHEKKRKLKQPLCDYNFGLPCGTHHRRRAFSRH